MDLEQLEVRVEQLPGITAQERGSAEPELMDMISTEFSSTQGCGLAAQCDRAMKPFGSDNHTDRSTEFTSRSFSSSRNTSFTNSVGIPSSIYGFGIAPEDSDNGSIASSSCATYTSTSRPAQRRKNDHNYEYGEAESALSLTFRAPTASPAYLPTPQKSSLVGNNTTLTPTPPPQWGFTATQSRSLSPPSRNISASANLCSALPLWSMEGYRPHPAEIGNDARRELTMPRSQEVQQQRLVGQPDFVTEAMQDDTDSQKIVEEIHHIEECLPPLYVERGGTAGAGLEVRVDSDTYSDAEGGEEDSIGTSLAVEVASLDDEGTYVGYGEEADDDVSTCADSSSLPPRARSRHNHHSGSGIGGGNNSDLEGECDGGYFLWAEDGAEELVREGGNGGRWGEDAHSLAGSDVRSIASRYTPPALRPVRPYHSPTDELEDASGSYAYPNAATHFSTDKLSAMASDELCQEAGRHSGCLQGFGGQQDQHGRKPASRTAHRKGYTIKHRAGELVPEHSAGVDESGGSGHGISGQKRNRSSGSTATNSSKAIGKRKR